MKLKQQSNKGCFGVNQLKYSYNTVAFMCPGESVSVLKQTEVIPDKLAVNQDKKNLLFSVKLLLIFRDISLMRHLNISLARNCCHNVLNGQWWWKCICSQQLCGILFYVEIILCVTFAQF